MLLEGREGGREGGRAQRPRSVVRVREGRENMRKKRQCTYNIHKERQQIRKEEGN
jgi:hypothetical protein